MNEFLLPSKVFQPSWNNTKIIWKTPSEENKISSFLKLDTTFVQWEFFSHSWKYPKKKSFSTAMEKYSEFIIFLKFKFFSWMVFGKV